MLLKAKVSQKLFSPKIMAQMRRLNLDQKLSMRPHSPKTQAPCPKVLQVPPPMSKTPKANLKHLYPMPRTPACVESAAPISSPLVNQKSPNCLAHTFFTRSASKNQLFSATRAPALFAT